MTIIRKNKETIMNIKKGSNPGIRLLKAIFFLSGITSLFYQVAWQRILTLFYGVGFISITLVVSVFMFGLGFGALWGGRIVDRIKDKIALYAFVEIVIGAFGFLSISFLEFLSKHTAGADYLYILLFSFIFLALPTFLMGATLPIICRIFSEIDNQLLKNVSFLYFLNTLGAAFGTVLCGYLFISIIGLDGVVYFASALNFALGLSIIGMKRKITKCIETYKTIEKTITSYDVKNYYIYFFAIVVGFLAIGYEIVWFRLISVFIKNSPYAFSSILFVYLMGIALGSYGMNHMVQRKRFVEAKYFYIFQAAISAYVLFSIVVSYYLGKYTAIEKCFELSFNEYFHPGGFTTIEYFLTLKGFLKTIFVNFDIFIWPLFFMFVPTLFMGATFPLLGRIATKKLHRTGSKIGEVYFFSALGNVLGGFCTGFVILPYCKTEGTLLIFAIIGILFLFPAFLHCYFKRKKLYAAICFPAAFILILLFPQRGEYYNFAHLAHKHQKAYIEEGRESVVAAFKDGNITDVYINGVPHGGRPGGIFIKEALDWMSYAKKLVIIP